MKKMGILISFFFLEAAIGITYPFHHDVLDELQKADFLSVSDEKLEQWKQLLSQNKMNLEDVRAIVEEANQISNSSHKEAILPKHFRVTKNVAGKVNHLVSIEGEDISLNSKHAIKNLAGYLENRIGRFFFKHLQEEKLKAFVLGSKPFYLEKDLTSILPVGDYDVTSIPSLYEKWGLYRYWVQSTKSSDSYYVLVVPPSTQYVRHYATLLESSGKYTTTVSYLNLEAQTKLRDRLKSFALEVRKNFGYISVLFFGYEKNWIQQIRTQDSAWDLSYYTQVTTPLGLNLHLLELKHKATQKTLRVASLQPEQTVWGELASFYFEALLGLSPKIVMFMGSAGSLREDLKPYQVSLPKEFYLPDGLVKMDNWLLKEGGESLKDTFQEARHSLTYSPVQQTRKYVRSLVEHNIDTVDVEQALVGRMIHEYNTQHQTQILFGAVNVITDQPGQVLVRESDLQHDLDILNLEEKERAKSKAAMIALQALDRWILRTNPVSCKEFLATEQSSLVPPE